MKLNEPQMRIIIRGSLDFFAVSFWHVKTKKISLSGTKVWGTMRDFCGATKFFLGKVRYIKGTVWAKPCLAHTWTNTLKMILRSL
jgi:hypothetical protein